VLLRRYPIDDDQVIRYWSYGTEDEENENEAEEEAAIKGEETEDVGDQVQGNFSEQSEQSGREDQEKKRREAMRRLQSRARRARLRSSLLCPPRKLSLARFPQPSSDEDLITSAEEIPQNERGKFIMSKDEHDRVNHLGKVFLSEEIEEAKTSLEAFLQEFARSDRLLQNSGHLAPDAPISLLIVRGFCHRICGKDLFCPYPRCKAEVKSISGIFTHLDKKHELPDVYCKYLRRHVIQGLYPGKVDVFLKTRDGVTVDRLWNVERCPCLGCDYFYNRYHKTEMDAKVRKGMYVNVEALG
jgi:hypothetical protein